MAEKWKVVHDLIFNKVQNYVNVWLFHKNLSHYFEGVYCGHYLNWELGFEFEITLTDGSSLNFDKSFLYFNVEKKIFSKVTFNLTINIEY